MLPEIHDGLRRLLYERGNIDPREVEVLFDAPTRERIDRLTRPAISLHLIGIEENTELRNASMDATRGPRSVERRMPPRRINLLYVVSVITTDTSDEHRLLWRALGTLLRYQQFPPELLPEGVVPPDPPLTAKAAQPDDGLDALAIWNGLGIAPRPSFAYVLTVPLDLEITISAPLVLTRTLRFLRGTEAGAVPDVFTQIGGVVRDRDGAPVPGIGVTVAGSAAPSVITAADGSFVLSDVPTGTLTLRLTRPDGATREATLVVPSDAYEVVLDW